MIMEKKKLFKLILEVIKLAVTAALGYLGGDHALLSNILN